MMTIVMFDIVCDVACFSAKFRIDEYQLSLLILIINGDMAIPAPSNLWLHRLLLRVDDFAVFSSSCGNLL